MGPTHSRLLIVEHVQELGDEDFLREPLALFHSLQEELLPKTQLSPGRLQQCITQPIGPCRKGGQPVSAEAQLSELRVNSHPPSQHRARY